MYKKHSINILSCRVQGETVQLGLCDVFSNIAKFPIANKKLLAKLDEGTVCTKVAVNISKQRLLQCRVE